MRRASQERFREIDEIFDAALDVPLAERDAFLATACGDDVPLRVEVQELLDAHSRSAAFLESPAVELGAALLDDAPGAELSPAAPDRAGAFRIVRELGHGGMGVVYLAEREGAEFQQRVALKLVRRLAGGAGVQHRFLEERRILARLEHPGIARFIDGGVTSDGSPWFAMELVEGESIDSYCDRHHLSVDQRLDLFGTVCDAVQYAHEHLVIHRDLKPSNILVRDDGQLKLLDFGIAKLVDPSGNGDDGAQTQTGLVALTPEFAAPEQVRGEAVTTATDTYALGVLLYGLLTGHRPYEVRGRTPAEVERIVCDIEPPRPSAVAPEKARRQLRGDLDLIVMKALHKDPARRYSSAASLRDDLRRFRTGLPVLARPDAVGYRLRKFVRRNRTVVAALLVTLVALVAATAFSATQMREAQRQRDAALQEISRQRAIVEVQGVLAGDARDTAGRQLSAEQRIALAEQVLTRKFRGEPWLVAEVMVGLSGRLYDLGDRSAQRAMLARARGISRAADAPTQLALANCARVASLIYDDQIDSARAALAEARAALARPDARTPLATASCLDAEGRRLEAEGKPDSAVLALRRAVEMSQTGDAAAIRLQVMVGLGSALRARGRTRDAVEIYRRAVTELDSAGYQGTDILPNVVSFLTSSLSEIGELATVDSVLGSLLRPSGDQARYSSALINFLYGQGKLRLGDIDSAETWIARAMRDTTEGAGGLSGYLPPAMTLLRLEQHRLAEARQALATLPTGTLTRRVNRSWLTARIRYAEGDRQRASAMLEDSLRVIVGDAAKPPPVLALPFVTAAEWRLAAGDARGADSLASLAHAAGEVDGLALERSGFVGRADLVRARARRALGDAAAARPAADRAVVALSNGYGPQNRWTREARAFRDSLPR